MRERGEGKELLEEVAQALGGSGIRDGNELAELEVSEVLAEEAVFVERRCLLDGVVLQINPRRWEHVGKDTIVNELHSVPHNPLQQQVCSIFPLRIGKSHSLLFFWGGP